MFVHVGVDGVLHPCGVIVRSAGERPTTCATYCRMASRAASGSATATVGNAVSQFQDGDTAASSVRARAAKSAAKPASVASNPPASTAAPPAPPEPDSPPVPAEPAMPPAPAGVDDPPAPADPVDGLPPAPPVPWMTPAPPTPLVACPPPHDARRAPNAIKLAAIRSGVSRRRLTPLFSLPPFSRPHTVTSQAK